jgi:hypothetical protein
MCGASFLLLVGSNRRSATAHGAVAAALALEEEEDPGGSRPANGPQAESFWASTGGKWWAARRVLVRIAYGLQK